MPSRLTTIGIVIFWLATTSWLMYRELAPRWNSGNPPKFALDMTDEVKKRITVLWEVSQNDEKVGTASTTILRRGKGMFELEFRMTFRANVNPTASLGRGLLALSKCNQKLLITRNGEIRQFSHLLAGDFASAKWQIKTWGTVSDNRRVDPKYEISGPFQKKIQGEPFTLDPGEDVLTIWFPANRVLGLYEGRQWSVPPHALNKGLVNGLLKKVLPIPPPASPELIARVYQDSLKWQGEEVACWRINLTKPKQMGLNEIDREVNFNYWVRRKDGLILRQEGSVAAIKLTYQRKP
ncbi:MAG: hypothetical protein ACFCD0_02475 [Gemmataceae bacterium]